MTAPDGAGGDATRDTVEIFATLHRLPGVGPNEPEGWRLAGTIVPVAYIAWSGWLILLGAFLLA